MFSGQIEHQKSKIKIHFGHIHIFLLRFFVGMRKYVENGAVKNFVPVYAKPFRSGHLIAWGHGYNNYVQSIAIYTETFVCTCKSVLSIVGINFLKYFPCNTQEKTIQ